MLSNKLRADPQRLSRWQSKPGGGGRLEENNKHFPPSSQKVTGFAN